MNGLTISGKVSMGKQSAQSSYRFFRVNVTGISGTYVRFAAVSIRVGLTDYPTVIGSMTSNTTPSPLVASASSTYGAGYEPYKAFVLAGSNASYRWISGGVSAPQWIQVDLGAGNEITPTSLRLCADDVGGSGYYVTNFTLLGSNTGAFSGEEATLYTSDTLDQGDWNTYGCVLFTF